MVNKKERGNPSHNCRDNMFKGLGMMTMILLGCIHLENLKWWILTNTSKERAQHGREFYSDHKLHQFFLKELETLDIFKFRMVSRIKEMKIRCRILKNVLQ